MFETVTQYKHLMDILNSLSSINSKQKSSLLWEISEMCRLTGGVFPFLKKKKTWKVLHRTKVLDLNMKCKELPAAHVIKM